MFGVLLDVSGSMRNAYALDKLHDGDDVSVERTHAVFTTVAKIVEREVTHHVREEYIFVCAFGLQDPEPAPEPVCNLIELFTNLRNYRLSQRIGPGQDELVELAKQNRAAHAEEWIRDHLTDREAALLNWILREDESLIPILLKKLPHKHVVRAVKLKCKAKDACTTTQQRPDRAATQRPSWTARALSLIGIRVHEPPSATVLRPPPPQRPPETSWDRTVKESEAYTYAQKIISEKFPAFSETLVKPIEPRSVMYVSQLMEELMNSEQSIACPSAIEPNKLHDDIQKLVNEIAPFIYGGTPLCMAMNEALHIFKQTCADTTKVLFILSDGESADGDPLPIAEELRALGVCIVTCYLTSDHIDSPKCMLDNANPNWSRNDGRLALFKMSSTMKNTHTPISYLIDVGWELPPSGESRLFVQANSLNVVNELCEIVVSQLAKGCDALVDVLEKLPLATYINQSNADFLPKRQQEGTCYANAIAATFHLAMQRIVGRDGGYPDFDTIRDRIIHEYGKHGAHTARVLEAVCPEYRLHFQKVDESGARKAINQRQPVVARFWLYRQQWEKFIHFFESTRKGILKRTDLETSECTLLIILHKSYACDSLFFR